MKQRILDLYKSILVPTGENTLRRSQRARILRFVIAITSMTTLTLICEFTTNPRVVLAVWSWILLGIIPMVLGTYVIFTKFAAAHPNIGVLLFATLLGLVALALTLSGMLYDEKTISHGWQFALTTGLQIGAITFSAVGFILLALSWLRSLNK